MCEVFCFFFQAEDGIRDLVRSRGLRDVYKRQVGKSTAALGRLLRQILEPLKAQISASVGDAIATACLLYTSDAADERSSVDLGGRRIIKKKTLALLQ